MTKIQSKKQEKNPAAAPTSPIEVPPIVVKHILVPVDFSESSRKALHYALAFARRFQAEITVMHVVPHVEAESRIAFNMPELQKALLKEGQEKLTQELARITAPVNLKPVVKRGVPFHEIVQTAQQVKADLVVIGTHGRTGLSHVFLGSTAERVARHAPCPVLVVREREDEIV